MIKTSFRFFEDIPVRAVWKEETYKWWILNNTLKEEKSEFDLDDDNDED